MAVSAALSASAGKHAILLFSLLLVPWYYRLKNVRIVVQAYRVVVPSFSRTTSSSARPQQPKVALLGSKLPLLLFQRDGMIIGRQGLSSSSVLYAHVDNNINNDERKDSVLDPQEISMVEDIWYAALSTSKSSSSSPPPSDVDDIFIEQTLQTFLPQMSPSLLLKLRTNDFNNNTKIQTVQRALSKIFDEKLQQSKDLLHSFLTAGEIRKLDGLIGKAAKENKLDSSFFAVLNANIQDAFMEQQQDSTNENNNSTNDRLQILRHIDTRCQEEVEKHVAPPGLALLHKLLRTDVLSIRNNILRHYLGPQPTTITTPDGQVIPLKSSSSSASPKALVTSTEFRVAIENAVAQIRQMEKVGGTDRTTAATMVESIRQTAKEARSALEECYGLNSTQLEEFEMGLMPVFRPDRGSIYSPE